MSDLAIINDYLLFELKALPADCFSTEHMTFRLYYIHPQHSCADHFLSKHVLKKYFRFLTPDQIYRLSWIYERIEEKPNSAAYYCCSVLLPLVQTVFDGDEFSCLERPTPDFIVELVKLYSNYGTNLYGEGNIDNEVTKLYQFTGTFWRYMYRGLKREWSDYVTVAHDWEHSMKEYTAEMFLEYCPDYPSLWYTFFDCKVKIARVADIYSYHFVIVDGSRSRFDLRADRNPVMPFRRDVDDPSLCDAEEDQELMLRIQEAEWLDCIVDQVISDLNPPEFVDYIEEEIPYYDPEKDICSSDDDGVGVEAQYEESFGVFEDSVDTPCVEHEDNVHPEGSDMDVFCDYGLLGAAVRVPMNLPIIQDVIPNLPKTPEQLLEDEEDLRDIMQSMADAEEDRIIEQMILEEQLDSITSGPFSWWDITKAKVFEVATKVKTDVDRVIVDTDYKLKQCARVYEGNILEVANSVRNNIDTSLDEFSGKIEDVTDKINQKLAPVVAAVGDIVNKQVTVAVACINCHNVNCNCKVQDFSNGNVEGKVLADHVGHAIRIVKNSVSPVVLLDREIALSSQDPADLVGRNVVVFDPPVRVLSEPREVVPRLPDPNPNQVDDYIIQPHKWAPGFVNETDEQLRYVTEHFQKVIYNLNRYPDIETKLAFFKLLTRDFQPIFVTCQRVSVVPIILTHDDYDMRPVNMNSSKVTVKAETLEKFMVTTTSIRLINNIFAYPTMAQQILNNLTDGSEINLNSICEIIIDTVELTSCPAIVISCMNSKICDFSNTSDVVRRSATVAVNQMTSVNLPAGVGYSDGRSVYDDSISMICHTRECRKWFRYGPGYFPRQ